MDKKIVVTLAPTVDVQRIMRDVFELGNRRYGNYQTRNKSDRKRDRKNRWR
ncbi:hypothetical protein VP381E491_P0078 [Vibrio phage 381E49-1]|nr:hypothetical protein VP381E491_P0078 [Vibrio phage 381E49-1]